MDSTWLLRLETTGSGPRLAVKDCIDVAGTVTTAGSRAVAATAVPARLDAPVVASARAQGARIVGKTNLVELCRRADGLNAWTGTPANPLDAGRIPGRSSSGSAVAVATGQADVAYGTDTGGSIRVPAACCGVAGLKTTAGRLPLNGITELSRTLDTVGPLARDVAGLVVGMLPAEPGFTVAEPPPGRAPVVARLRPAGVDPAVDAAVDTALRAAGARWADVEVPEWEDWCDDADDLLVREGWLAQRGHLDHVDLVEPRHAEDIAIGETIPPARVVACRRTVVRARVLLDGLLDRFDVLALPTLADPVPRVDDVSGLTHLTVPLNLTGHPAVTLPLPLPTLVDGTPASLQLVGGWCGEEALLGWAAHVECAVRGSTRAPADGRRGRRPGPGRAAGSVSDGGLAPLPTHRLLSRRPPPRPPLPGGPMTDMTPEQENAFYADPDNQVPQGLPVRRRPRLGEPVPVRFPTSSSARSVPPPPTIGPCRTGSAGPSNTSSPAAELR